jgi:hypothetical protein
MDVACDFNSGMRILNAVELTNVAGGCLPGCDCWSATLVHEGEQAPAGSWYLTSITRGAVFITPGPCALQN